MMKIDKMEKWLDKLQAEIKKKKQSEMSIEDYREVTETIKSFR